MRGAWARVTSWARAVARRGRLETEMEAELRFHRESYAEDLMRKGVAAEEAERRARAAFGPVEAHKEAMRDSLGLRWWNDAWNDARYALRQLRRSPGFAGVAVLSLALGIGANTAIFTLANRVLYLRLGVEKPESVRLLSWAGGRNVAVHSMWGDWYTSKEGNISSTSFSYPVYEYLKTHNEGLEELFAFKGIGRLNVTVKGTAEAAQAEMVSGNYYRALGVRVQAGRPIEPADDGAPGSGPVVVISDGFWERFFGRSEKAIGTVIQVNLTPMTIVGVNPPEFTGAKSAQSSPDIFLPFSMQPAAAPKTREGSLLVSKDLWWMQIMGRKRAGVSDREAGARLSVALSQAVRATMTLRKGDEAPKAVVRDGSRGLNFAGRNFLKPVAVLMTLGGLVLLLACANIANLLLARSAWRQREMSVRLALGAGRGRIVRQVLTESLVLAGLGGVAGLAAGYASQGAIPALLANAWERNDWAGGFDWRVFAFTAAVTVLTGLLFGAAPAWRAAGRSAGAGLKESAHTATRRWRGLSGKALVTFQVMLSTILVAGAVLFLRTLGALNSAPLGFNADGLVLFSVEPPAARYPAPRDVALYRRIEEALAAIPGVESATLSSVPLLADSMNNDDFVPEGQARTSDGQQVAFDNEVGANFFATMETPILAGRGFAPGDTESSLPVAVVNQALARKFFPGANPVGKAFRTHVYVSDQETLVRIVGVCGDARYAHLRDEAPPVFYSPYRQMAGEPNGMTYEVRTRLKPAALMASIRGAMRSIDRDLPLIDVRTQREQIEAGIAQERLFAELTTGFGLLALALACIGVYGVMAYTVARRTNEIGIRLALGAERRAVLWMIVREAAWIGAGGVAAGVGAAAAVMPLVRTMLYGVKPADPASLGATGVLLLGAALAAAWAPAMRAARVEPLAALRHE